MLAAAVALCDGTRFSAQLCPLKGHRLCSAPQRRSFWLATGLDWTVASAAATACVPAAEPMATVPERCLQSARIARSTFIP